MDLLLGIPVWLDVVYVLPPKFAFAPELTAEEKKTRTMHAPSLPKPAMEPTTLKIASNPPVNRYAGGFKQPGLYRVPPRPSGRRGARSRPHRPCAADCLGPYWLTCTTVAGGKPLKCVLLAAE
jgi:hypothetical protein